MERMTAKTLGDAALALSREDLGKALADAASTIASLELRVSELQAQRDRIAAEKLEVEGRNRELEAEIANMRELQALARARRFKPSTEQTLSLFNEGEAIASLMDPEDGEDEEAQERLTGEKPRGRAKRKPCSVPASTPVTDVYHTDGAVESFVRDGVEYVRDGEKVVDKLAVVPARLVIERHHFPAYRTKGVDVPGRNRMALLRDRATDGCGASPSLLAKVICDKFASHLPLYRQEGMLSKGEANVSRQKMSTWLLSAYGLVIPLIGLMKEEVYKSALLNKDETPIQVLDVKGKSGKPSSSGFMCVTIGSTYDRESRMTRSIALFEYITSRCGAVLTEDCWKLGYHGFVMTDGLAGYNRLDPQTHASCWVHAIRRFKEVLKADPRNKEARELAKLFGRLYEAEGRHRGMLLSGASTPEGFLSGRKADAEPIIDDIFRKAKDYAKLYAPGSAMGNAIAYLQQHKGKLCVYLDCIECTPDNNAAENAIRPFTLGRKNWLFAKSVDGADSAAAFYTLVENAKGFGLPPEDYVEAVLMLAPECKDKGGWERLLPWNIDLGIVAEARARRLMAKPDPGRDRPYMLSGVSR